MVFVLEKSCHVTFITMYKREKSSTSCFSEEIWPACLFLVLGVGRLNNGREFFLIGSCIERDLSLTTDLSYSSYSFFPNASTVRTVATTDSSTTSLVSSTKSSGVASRKANCLYQVLSLLLERFLIAKPFLVVELLVCNMWTELSLKLHQESGLFWSSNHPLSEC